MCDATYTGTGGECGAAFRIRGSEPSRSSVRGCIRRARGTSRRREEAGIPPSALPSEERRLVTALFCDLVGFTPLSEQLDPEDVREVQAAHFRAMSTQVEGFGGIVEKYAGDAVLTLFGVPVAHEDDPERAVLCALGMQQTVL